MGKLIWGLVVGKDEGLSSKSRGKAVVLLHLTNADVLVREARKTRKWNATKEGESGELLWWRAYYLMGRVENLTILSRAGPIEVVMIFF